MQKKYINQSKACASTKGMMTVLMIMKTSLSETFVWFTTFAFSLSLSKECGESDGNDNEVQQPAVFLFSSSTRSLKIVR